MTILLVGNGYWGQNWAKTLSSLGVLAGICDLTLTPDNPHYATAQQQFPQATLYNRLEPALASSKVTGVVIATPVPTHFNVARHALLAGKHVFVEKPLTLSPQEAQVLVHLAQEKQRLLAVGHVLMYHSGLLALKNLVDQGTLGRVMAVHCSRFNLGKIRNEENVWWSLAPHDISILSMLLKEPLQVTHVEGHALLGRPTIEDEVRVTLTTPSGVEASIHVNWLAPLKRHETVVVGTQKMAIFDDALAPGHKLRVLDYQLKRHGEVVQSIERISLDPLDYPAGDPPLTAQAKAFLDAIDLVKINPALTQEGPSPLLNDGINGLQVVTILDEVEQRLAQQRSPLNPAGEAPSTGTLAMVNRPSGDRFVPFS